MVGDRWTLLIVRELLIAGACRYTDLQQGLPGIATNLLADRLRELETAGLIERSEVPPPVARTVYSLTEVGWAKVLPVIRAVATFGMDLVELAEDAVTPLNGFLAGILLGFDDPTADTGVDASYRVDVDDRRFELAVRDGRPSKPHDPPVVTVTASAADLIWGRRGGTASQRKAALGRVKFDGDPKAVSTFKKLFRLSA